jgi:hypothetical protein
MPEWIDALIRQVRDDLAPRPCPTCGRNDRLGVRLRLAWLNSLPLRITNARLRREQRRRLPTLPDEADDA